MRRSLFRAVVASGLLALLATRSVGADPAPVRPVLVLAAAGLKTALDAVGREWTSATGNKVSFSYASSPALARQIENGAPADVFASADLAWMDYLQSRRQIRPATRVSLLTTDLVLVAPRDRPVALSIEKGMKLAATLGSGRLAMGDPRSVPAGIYAREALTSLGVWDEVAAKVAGTENARAALAFVARGEAPLGIVYLTDAASEPRVTILGTFPARSHKPIEFPFAVTTASAHPFAAQFLDYLKGPGARRVFEAAGFRALP